MDLLEYPELSYSFSQMEEKNFNSPEEAVEYFFLSFSLNDAKKRLWDFFKEWSGSEIQYSGKEHSEMLFFYQMMCAVTEAVYLIDKRRARKS